MSTLEKQNVSYNPSKIIGIQFSILSPDEIRKSSVAEITSRDTYENNKPKGKKCVNAEEIHRTRMFRRARMWGSTVFCEALGNPPLSPESIAGPPLGEADPYLRGVDLSPQGRPLPPGDRPLPPGG